MTLSPDVEWAVIERGFRGQVTVHRGDLGSEEEAQAWLYALQLTRIRSDREALRMRDAHVIHRDLEVAWRETPYWQSARAPE